MPNSEPDPEVHYWDSCIPLAYITGEPERVATIEEALRRARAREIVIVTSVFTITEVAFAAEEKANGQLDPAIEERIGELWKPASPIKIVEFHQLLASAARDLMRAAIARNHALQPADAIHLATAQNQKAAEFHTYDERLQKHSPWVGFPIVEPTNPQEPLFGA